MGHAVVIVILSAGFPNALIAQVLGWGAVGLQALYRAGLRVPQDISVIGYDDIELARYLTPPLTTIHYR